MLEHGAYTLLMDAIYDREIFPTLDEALDWAWARDEAEVAAVKFVLTKFFELQNDGRYVQKRICDELMDYEAKAETKSDSSERDTNDVHLVISRLVMIMGSEPDDDMIHLIWQPFCPIFLK